MACRVLAVILRGDGVWCICSCSTSCSRHCRPPRVTLACPWGSCKAGCLHVDGFLLGWSMGSVALVSCTSTSRMDWACEIVSGRRSPTLAWPNEKQGQDRR